MINTENSMGIGTGKKVISKEIFSKIVLNDFFIYDFKAPVVGWCYIKCIFTSLETLNTMYLIKDFDSTLSLPASSIFS